MGGRRGRRDRDVFERFCADEYGRLVAAVAIILGDPDIAADAVNEALARAWNRVRRGHDIESLGAWIRVVALNHGYDQYRRRAVERRHLPMLVAGVDEAHNKWGLSLDVQAALAALPRRQREVAVLHYICDLSVTAIADELHISCGTVKTCLQRARVALEGTLQGQREGVSAHEL
jgi:RNA polymerase sigma-70 factor (ECF subfamily)